MTATVAAAALGALVSLATLLLADTAGTQQAWLMAAAAVLGAAAAGGALVSARTVRALMHSAAIEHEALSRALCATEQSLAEAHASATRLRAIIDHSGAVLYVKDREGRYLMANRGFRDAFGLEESEMLGRDDSELMESRIAAAWQANDREVWATGEPLEVDEVAPHEDGARRYLSLKFPIRDNVGVMYAVGGISTDISARVMLEERRDLAVNVLERLAAGEPLIDVVTASVRLAESGMKSGRAACVLFEEPVRAGATPASRPRIVLAEDESDGALEFRALLETLAPHLALQAPQHLEDAHTSALFGAALQGAAAPCPLPMAVRPLKNESDDLLGTMVLCYEPAPLRGPRDVPWFSDSARLAALAIESHRKSSLLKSSEERFELAMRASNDGLWDWDLRTDEVYYSPRWQGMLGYQPGELSGTLDTWAGLVNPADKTRVLQLIKQALNDGHDQFTTEFQMRHRAGHWIDVLSRAVMLRDDDGEPVRIVGTHVDITGMRETERELASHKQSLEKLAEQRASEIKHVTEYNRELFMTTPVGIALRDLDTRKLLDANPAYLGIIGYTDREARELPFNELCPPSMQPPGISFAELQDNGGQYPVVEAEYVHKDGHRIQVQLHGTVIDIYGKQHLLSVVEDISNRKQMEQELRERGRELAHAQSIAHLGSFQYDLVNRDLRVSDECYRIFSIELGAPFPISEFWHAVHPGDIITINEALDAVDNRNPMLDVEHRIIINGEQKWIRLRAELERGEDGRLLRMAGTSQDITEIKLAELATQKALAEARQLASARSNFIANMSHEVRTPLNGVLGFAQVGYRVALTDRSRGLFSKIEIAGRQLLQIVNDVLDFSKMEAGKLRLELRPFDVRELVDEVADLFRAEASAKGVMLNVEIDPGVADCYHGDRLRVTQILNNLVGNAVKFTHVGTISVQVKARANVLRFHVRDTGIGISGEQLGELFEPFEQGDSSTTREYGGTGLGLAIAAHLARLMGGEVSVQSEPGAGSHFTATLALARALEVSVDDSQQIPGSAVRRLEGIRVLAVEDNPQNRALLDDLLGEEAAHTTLCADGNEAVALLDGPDAPEFDVVLMDIQMPGMDGYQTTREMLRRRPALPVIGLTAHALAEVRRRCFASGMVNHVPKPIDMDTLVAAIQAAVNHEQRKAASSA